MNDEQLIMKLEKGMYSYIGKGSARYVYDLGGGYVAKVARNKKGYAQNQKEYEIFQREKSNLLAEVFYMCDNYYIIIMEKADPVHSNYQLKNDLVTFYGANYYSKLKEITRRNRLLMGDIKRLSSWGNIEGRPVLIDYGFTYDVRKRYY